MAETLASEQDGAARVRSLALRALQLADAGRDAEAVGEIEAAAQLAPDDAVVHVACSAINRQAGRRRDALHAAREAVRLAPHDSSAHRMLAFALERAGRRREAAEAARRAAELAPEDPRVLRCLGDMALDADPAEAERLYRRTLWRDSRSVAARIGLARALRRLGRRDEAEDVLRRAEAVDPSVGELRRRASALWSAIFQAAVGTFLAIVVLGRVPSLVGAQRPELSGITSALVTLTALVAPLALLGWTARRVRRLAREAPASVDGREDLRDVAELLRAGTHAPNPAR